MLAFLNLGLTEMVVILVVAIVVFGRNLPQVAVQAATTVAKMRRSLTDLRRETGIDEELRRARQEFEQAIPRDLPKIIEQKIERTLDAEERAEAETDTPESKAPGSNAPGSEAPGPEASGPETPEAGASESPAIERPDRASESGPSNP